MNLKSIIAAACVLSVTVMAFGAPATFQINGAGTTYASLVDAYNTAVAGDVINASIGEYTLDVNFVWDKPVDFIGSGANIDPLLGTVIKGNANGFVILFNASGPSAADKTLFKDFNLNMNLKKPGFNVFDNRTTAATPATVQNIKLQNIVLNNGAQSAEGLYTSGAGWHVLKNWDWDNVNFTNLGTSTKSYGIRTQQNNIIDGWNINNCKFNQLKNIGVQFGALDNDPATTTAGYQITKNVTITNSQFNGNTWMGLWFQVSGSDSAVENIVIKNNQFVDNLGALGGTRDIDINFAFRGATGTAKNIQIKGNTFTHTGARAGLGSGVYVNNFDAAVAPSQLNGQVIALQGNTFTGYASAISAGKDVGALYDSPRTKFGVSGAPVVVGQGAVALYEGDLDCNGTVDFDNAYLTVLRVGMPTTKGWTDGDFNLSGAVDFDDAYAAVIKVGAPGIVAATTPGVEDDAKLTLIYNKDTGVVTIDCQVATAGLNVKSASGLLLGANMNMPADGMVPQRTATQIGWLAFANVARDGWNLGQVLPANLTAATLLADLEIGYSISGVFEPLFGDLIVVPEPVTMALLGLGGLVAIRRRRA